MTCLNEASCKFCRVLGGQEVMTRDYSRSELAGIISPARATTSDIARYYTHDEAVTFLLLNLSVVQCHACYLEER